MAESKQYITQLQDNGSVLISEDVIAAIVAHAAGEVEGVVSLNTKPGADIAELIGKKNWGRGLKITILEDNSVSVEDPKLLREEKLAVIMGTEGDGLSDHTIKNCDYTVKIPMYNGVDSLNVSAAAAITFWELTHKK